MSTGHANHRKTSSSSKESLFTKTHVVLIAVILIVAIFNFALLQWPSTFVSDSSSDSPYAQNTDTSLGSSSGLTAIMVMHENCDGNCMDPRELLSGFDVFSISFDEISEVDNTDSVVDEFNIDRFPAIVLRGEHELLSQFDVLEKMNDAYVWREIGPPYVDSEGSLKGMVELLAIDDASCEECVDPTILAQQLEGNGVVFSKTEVVDASDATELITKHNISRVPTIILSSDASEYLWLEQAWEPIGHKSADGSLVLDKTAPPFVDLASGEVRGLLSVTLIESDCVDCVSASRILSILEENLALHVSDKSVLQEDQAKSLIDQYNITTIPTLILSEEAAVYPAIEALWTEFGSIESDGSYVVRDANAFNLE